MASLSPLNESGKPVDWWFIYKVPHLSGNNSSTGYEYFYFDPVSKKLALSPNKLTFGAGALDATLNSVFKSNNATTGWIPYNDEMPPTARRKDSSAYGHTKGLIAFDVDSNTALWLVHSWPKDPEPDDTTLHPTPVYGQTFMCMSLSLDSANQLAELMINHQEPQVYLSNVPAKLPRNQGLYRLSQPVDTNAAAASGTLDLKTRGNFPFKVIAKNKKWNDDFWNNLVGPTLKEDLDVESWIRGKIPSIEDSDGIHKTFDITYVDTRRIGGKWAWPETQDHAKWGLTHQNNWVCVGDINRMVSQAKRGGGTIALQSPELWAALEQLDIVVPPPGWTDGQTMAAIKATHNNTAPVKAPKKPAQIVRSKPTDLPGQTAKTIPAVKKKPR